MHYALHLPQLASFEAALSLSSIRDVLLSRARRICSYSAVRSLWRYALHLRLASFEASLTLLSPMRVVLLSRKAKCSYSVVHVRHALCTSPPPLVSFEAAFKVTLSSTRDVLLSRKENCSYSAVGLI